MPPRSVVPQCIFGLGTPQRCRNPGIGSPPLCGRHFAVVDEGPPPPSDDSLAAAIGVLLRHPSVEAIIDSFQDLVAEIQEQPDPHYAECPPRPRPAPQWRPPPPPPNAPRNTAPDPRVVMGFGPDTKLTKQMIKQRQRDLAGLCHPDRGGSDEAMKRINGAVETLLRQVR